MESQEKLECYKSTLSDLGSYLTSQYGILRKVFSYLSFYDLLHCKIVCRDWKEAAVRTIKGRRKIHCLTLQQHQSESIESDAELTISFSTVPCESNPSAFYSKETHNFLSKYGVFSILCDSKPISLRNRAELPLIPRSFLQTAVRFPQTEGVFYKTSTIELDKLVTVEHAESILKVDDFTIKALIIIVYDDPDDRSVCASITNVLDAVTNIPLNCAIGGCRLMEDEDDVKKLITLFMIGGPNVEASSCVLDSQCRNEQAINNRLELFSKEIEPLPNSVILAFRCCDRNKVRRRYNYQPRENVVTWETTSIKTIFPKTPTIGCYGIGEFGVNFPTEGALKRQRYECASSLEYGFSTILVHIAFRK